LKEPLPLCPDLGHLRRCSCKLRQFYPCLKAPGYTRLGNQRPQDFGVPARSVARRRVSVISPPDAAASARPSRAGAAGNPGCKPREQLPPSFGQRSALCRSPVPSGASLAVRGRCKRSRSSCYAPAAFVNQPLAFAFGMTAPLRWQRSGIPFRLIAEADHDAIGRPHGPLAAPSIPEPVPVALAA